MDNLNQEPLNQVLNYFDIVVKSIKIEIYKEKKGVWWINSDKGLMVLKKISNSEQTLKYIISAIRHLDKNGVHFPPIIQTKDGRDYAIANGSCYVLSGAINGKNPSYKSIKELEIVIKELAHFHRASQGFNVLPDTKPKIHLGEWKENLSSRIEDMKGFYELERLKNSSNGIGQFVVAEFPYFYERALSAIKQLDGEEYRAWVEKARTQGALCHQDFAAGNLILTSSGNLYVLDTDSITIDIPARDLRKILCKIMKKDGTWDAKLTKKIFSIYQSVNPLTASEWKVVMFDILYPHLFIGAMNKYYYNRDKEWTEEKYLKRMKEMCAFEKTIEPIIDHFDALIPL